MFEDIAQSIIAFVRDNQHLAIPVAFLVAFGESFCFLSVLWPGTAILAGIAGLYAASGIGSGVIVPMTLSAALGGTLGYAVSYWIGYYFKDSIDGVWPFRNNPALIRKGEYFFQKYGAWSVFLGHFFGPVRAVIPVVAGMFAMRQLPFQIANVASAVIWAGGVIASAFYVVTYSDELFTLLKTYQAVAAAGLFCLAAILALPYSMVFWPTLIAFVGLGFIELYAGANFITMWLAGTGGAIIGDIAAYTIGKTRKDDLLNLRFLGGNAGDVASALKEVENQGALAILPSKAGTLSRSLVPVMAGATALAPAKFVPASIFSSAVWAAVLLTPGAVWQMIGG